MTAIHDIKPLVLSFPLSLQFCICFLLHPGWSGCLLALLWGESELPSRFWLMGAWQVAVGYLFSFSLLFKPVTKIETVKQHTHTENGENSGLYVIYHVGIFRDAPAVRLAARAPSSVSRHLSLSCTLCWRHAGTSRPSGRIVGGRQSSTKCGSTGRSS